MASGEVVVSICCTTYNHEKFVRDAIEGLLLQKTSYSMEIIIHDDASSDNTAEIIREYADKYPDLIVPILQKENQYAKGVRPWREIIFPRTRGKYIALCEGDDFWIDPLKLQKQVDFLEANPDYGMAHGYCYVLDEKNKAFRPSMHANKERRFLDGDIFEAALLDNCIYTCSTCIRKEFIDEYVRSTELALQRFQMSDYPLWLLIARHSLVKYFDEPLGVYRVTDTSASCRSDLGKRKDFIRSAFAVRNYYANKYKVPSALIKKIAVLEAQNRLFFAYLMKDRREAEEMVEQITKRYGEKLDAASYLNHLGTKGWLGRVVVKVYRRCLVFWQMINYRWMENTIRIRIDRVRNSVANVSNRNTGRGLPNGK